MKKNKEEIIKELERLIELKNETIKELEKQNQILKSSPAQIIYINQPIPSVPINPVYPWYQPYIITTTSADIGCGQTVAVNNSVISCWNVN